MDHSGTPVSVNGDDKDVADYILTAAVRGDRQAFATILRHYDHRLRVLAYRLLEDRNETDDVLQDVAVKLYRTLPSFRRESALGTWLYRLTYTTCIDHLRRRKPVDPWEPQAMPQPRDSSPDPADVLVQTTAAASILSSLPPQQRAVVLLVDQEGYDYDAAAAIIGIPRGTVASRLNAARGALRRALSTPVLQEHQ
jgi:RNA polymerase sigma-70 factor, ECF subfamily